MQTDSKIVSYKTLEHRLKKERKGKKVVVVTGTFDMLHGGHLIFLDFAKRQGDILVVGFGSDRVVKKYKGASRPIYPETLRSRMLAALEVVDYVVCVDEEPENKISGKKFLRTVKPDAWVVPYRDHNPAGIRALAKELGFTLVRNPRIAPKSIDFAISTSYIIKKIQGLK